jgi:hypothetical protein
MLLLPTAAHADEAGRNCKRYWAQGIVGHPWNYEACVKIIYNPDNNDMQATGKVTSSTPGIRIRVYALRLYVEDERGNTVAIRSAPTTGFHTDGFASTTTSVFDCTGAYVVSATIGTDAYWPNGVYSPVQNTNTWFGPPINDFEAYLVCL